jgi:hypothetical protein
VLLARLGPAYVDALGAQRRLLRHAWGAHGGTELGTEGDSFFVVFPTAAQAVAASAAAQRALADHSGAGGEQLRVRIGIHTGTADQGSPENHRGARGRARGRRTGPEPGVPARTQRSRRRSEGAGGVPRRSGFAASEPDPDDCLRSHLHGCAAPDRGTRTGPRCCTARRSRCASVSRCPTRTRSRSCRRSWTYWEGLSRLPTGGGSAGPAGVTRSRRC